MAQNPVSPGAMTPRERILAVLQRKEPDRIPFFEDFFDLDAEEKFIPRYAGLIARGARPTQRSDPALMIEMLRLLDRDVAEAGSARLQAEVAREDDREQILRFENGALWRYSKHPANAQPFHLPLEGGGDPAMVPMPDPHDPHRYQAIALAARVLKAGGYFTIVKLHGFFAGAHYLLRPFENLLMDMASDESYAESIIARIGEHTLACAEEVLKLGSDCLFIGDDLGSTNTLLISPRMYRRFVQPWHARLATLCHAHGAFLHVHSHGHILPIMDDLADAGIDVMDPLGPSDGIDLENLLARYAHRMVIAGGISKFIGQMSLPQLDEHLRHVISTGARYGSFILRSEGGIPPDMTHDAFRFYLAKGRQYREGWRELKRLRP